MSSSSRPLEMKYIIQRDDKNKKNMKCTLCNGNITGSVTRVRYHYLGGSSDVKRCAVANENSTEAEYADFIKRVQAKYNVSRAGSVASEAKKAKIQHNISQMGSFNSSSFSPSPFSQESGSEVEKSKTQGSLMSIWKPQQKHDVDRLAARLFYAEAIPFNVIRSPHFKSFIDAAIEFGKGYKLPSYERLRTGLLEEEVTAISTELDEMKKNWKRTGCTIVSDGWSDSRRRPLLNVLAVSPVGAMFLKSIDTSNEQKTSHFISKCIESVILEIGEENVVQVITDNAANCKGAGDILMDRFPHLYWTPCAAHVLDLLLEDLSKLEWVNNIVIEGKQISKFILNHRLTLTLYRSFAKRELLSPAETRFATNFITLQREVEERTALRKVMVADEWVESKLSKESHSKDIEKIILGDAFWEGAKKTIMVFEPLVRILRMVDGNQPCMGFVYEGMDRAKEEIQNVLANDVDEVKRIWDIVDKRWFMLHRPLHAAACYLDPKLIEADHDADEEIKKGIFATIDRLIIEEDDKEIIRQQLIVFKNQQKMFGLKEAKSSMMTWEPSKWWQSYGASTPQLQKLAVRIFSQCSSASACERNWSTHDLIHTNKRNRLGAQKLSDLVFVHSNLRLLTHSLANEDDYSRLGEACFGDGDNVNVVDEPPSVELELDEDASNAFDMEAGFNVADV